MWVLASMIGSTCVTLLCEDEDMGRIGRDRVRKEERSKEDSGGRKHGEEEREKKKEIGRTNTKRDKVGMRISTRVQNRTN